MTCSKCQQYTMNQGWWYNRNPGLPPNAPDGGWWYNRNHGLPPNEPDGGWWYNRNHGLPSNEPDGGWYNSFIHSFILILIHLKTHYSETSNGCISQTVGDFSKISSDPSILDQNGILLFPDRPWKKNFFFHSYLYTWKRTNPKLQTAVSLKRLEIFQKSLQILPF